MRSNLMPVVALALGLAGCGGGSTAASGLPLNLFTGTLDITSALPAGTTTCQGTALAVSITAAGSLPHTISAAGGECVTFTNNDAVAHRPASYGTVACPELAAPSSLAAGQSFTTGPLAGPKTCMWQDVVNPPGSTGGGGGGGGGY
jgi:plastocyanin